MGIMKSIRMILAEDAISMECIRLFRGGTKGTYCLCSHGFE